MRRGSAASARIKTAAHSTSNTRAAAKFDAAGPFVCRFIRRLPYTCCSRSSREAHTRAHFLERRRHVAAVALLAETAVVDVVAFVTADACRRQGNFRGHRSLMACLAMQSAVAAVELEMRAPVVIEVPRFPRARVMALLALRSECPLVLVVLLVTGDAARGSVLERRRRMALFALDLDVRAEQRKAREAVVEARVLPRAFAMAALALVALLALVLVVFPVAGDAGARELVAVEVAGMAAVALHRGVFAAQRISGVAVVVEQQRAPVLLAVTGRAFFAVARLVHVVLLVARDAGRRKLLFIKKPGVAAFALREAMFAAQRILGIAVVIEQDDFPVFVGVATLALGPELGLVRVVLAVTRDALRRRSLEPWIGVTIATIDVAMLARQRKARLAVIEARLFPFDVGMAVGARRTEAALVFVVLLVACHALGRRLAKFLARLVAVAAFDFRSRVRAFEKEIGHPMIERARVERGDVHVAAFMLGVARAAFVVLEPPVIALVRLHVARHVLVTIEAAPGLRGTVEAHVALRAVALDVRVPVYQFSGREHALDRIGAGDALQREAQGQKQDEPEHQYMCTAMTWTTALTTSRYTSGTCRTCHQEKRRA